MASARREITGDSYVDVVEVLAPDGSELWRDRRAVWQVQWTGQGQLLVDYSSMHTAALYEISAEGSGCCGSVTV